MMGYLYRESPAESHQHIHGLDLDPLWLRGKGSVPSQIKLIFSTLSDCLLQPLVAELLPNSRIP